jgi:hypothetical protein
MEAQMLLIGYARVSKADGSQTVAPQRSTEVIEEMRTAGLPL